MARIEVLATGTSKVFSEIPIKTEVQVVLEGWSPIATYYESRFTPRDRETHVGIFRKKYNPRKPNTVSGAQAARIGGNCPTAPIASVSADAAQ